MFRRQLHLRLCRLDVRIILNNACAMHRVDLPITENVIIHPGFYLTAGEMVDVSYLNRMK